MVAGWWDTLPSASTKRSLHNKNCAKKLCIKIAEQKLRSVSRKISISLEIGNLEFQMIRTRNNEFYIASWTILELSLIWKEIEALFELKLFCEQMQEFQNTDFMKEAPFREIPRELLLK